MTTQFDKLIGSGRGDAFVALLYIHGEDVEYCKPDGTRRPIKAIINRSPPAQYDTAGKVVIPKAIARVRNHATKGILDTELQPDDRLIYKVKKNDTEATDRAIEHLQDADGGVCRLNIR